MPLVQEAMRMYPVTCDGTNRIATRDVRLGGHFIPKGTMVWLPFSAMFNSPHNFEQPDRYMPVRPPSRHWRVPAVCLEGLFLLSRARRHCPGAVMLAITWK